MKRLILALLAVLPTIVSADSPMAFKWKADTIVPPAVVEPIFRAAAKIARYPLSSNRPTVIVVSDAKIQSWVCPGTTCLAYGLYIPALPDVIFLNESVPVWRRAVTLVHESTHYLQTEAKNFTTDCLSASAAEMEAHATAFRYMALNHIDGSMYPPQYICEHGVPQ